MRTWRRRLRKCRPRGGTGRVNLEDGGASGGDGREGLGGRWLAARERRRSISLSGFHCKFIFGSSRTSLPRALSNRLTSIWLSYPNSYANTLKDIVG